MSDDIKFSNHWPVEDKQLAKEAVMRGQEFIQLLKGYLDKKIKDIDSELTSDRLYVVPGWEGRLATLLGQKKAFGDIYSAIDKFCS